MFPIVFYMVPIENSLLVTLKEMLILRNHFPDLLKAILFVLFTNIV